jgi:hypothetical protein
MDLIEVVPSSTRTRAAMFMAGAAALYVVLHLVKFHILFSGDAEGLSALLQIIGTLYSVVYAFATYVIWGQFAAVENEIMKESGALKDLIQFSRGLTENTRDPIVRAVRAYARAVVESEWGILSRGEDTEHTERLFSTVIASVTEIKPSNEGERSIHERLLDIAHQASGHRQERLALSAKRMPKTLLLFVSLTAFSILFLLLLFPFHSLLFGFVAMALATMLLFLAHFVLTDLDNPFEGTWNVKSDSFHELATKYR